jgi:hypothetical protein
MSTQTFHLGDLLSITTGVLVSPSRMDGVYEILQFLVGEPLWTHQLPRARDECATALIRQFPLLADITVPQLDGAAKYAEWLDEQCEKYGTYFEVSPMDPADHTSINPLAEIAMIAPDLPVIVVETPEPEVTP